MSQHTVFTKYQGRDAKVLIGWEHRLQHFFMIVDLIETNYDYDNEDSSLEKEYIYSNLDDPNLDKNWIKESPGQYKDILDVYEIELPPQLWNELIEDKNNNVGDSNTVWNPDGTKQ